MSDPDVGRSTVSSSSSAEATHVSPDNSGNKLNHQFLMKQTAGPLITTVYQRQLPDSPVACSRYQRANIPSSFLKFCNHRRELWSVLRVK